MEMVDLDNWYDIDGDHPGNLPPGDEAFLQSHAGGEAILHEILEGMTSKFAFPEQEICFITHLHLKENRRSTNTQGSRAGAH